ncbi:MAG TPA: MmgE/PrpD family protein [Candidatus Binataceae bacterium]|nr:MmgE/PrpD family protein [Candidatus Binataceae bacterium]
MAHAEISPDIARFAAELDYGRIPARIADKIKLQALSVLGGSFAGSRSSVCEKIYAAVREWGDPDRSDAVTVVGRAEKLPIHQALHINTAQSIVHDFDDYLFAGHTGHSAILPAFSWAEKQGRSGRDVITAAAVANEVGGRLGSAFLLGPQNGQMWSYIHLLEAACVAGRFLGLDSAAMNHAIGIAFSQPPYPLIPAFFGPDSKAILAATPTIAGTQAAQMAAHGVTGARDILGGRDGFIRRVAERPLYFQFSGYGTAWLTDSLCFKLFPGCAYIDTAMDAFDAIESARGAQFAADEVESIRCEANFLTSGMEMLSQRYGNREELSPITVNFSVALSLAVKIAGGALAPEMLEHDWLARNRDRICGLADRVKVELSSEMSAKMSGLDSVGIDLRRILAAPDGDYRPSLDGVSFEHYRMAFPVRLTIKTRAGDSFTGTCEVPLGGAGRPTEETRATVRKKFVITATKSIGPDRAERAAAMIARLEELNDLRELAALLRP